MANAAIALAPASISILSMCAKWHVYLKYRVQGMSNTNEAQTLKGFINMSTVTQVIKSGSSLQIHARPHQPPSQALPQLGLKCIKLPLLLI